jgi:hypothetical protein
VAGRQQEQLPLDGLGSAESALGLDTGSRRPASRHPVALARADWIAEPLFAAPVPERVPDGALRKARRAPRRRARLSPAQVAARDRAAQPALFEMSEARPAPAHRAAPSRGRPQRLRS